MLIDCRERCGGMGYLEANRFGYAIAGSHSSRTAEGDNAVLMNKVASELIQKIGKNKKEAGSLVFKRLAKSSVGPLNRINIIGATKNKKLDMLRDIMYDFYEFQMAELLLEMKDKTDKHGRVSAWMEYCQVYFINEVNFIFYLIIFSLTIIWDSKSLIRFSGTCSSHSSGLR